MKVPLFAQHERGQRDRFVLSPKVLSEAAGQTYAEHRALLGKEGLVSKFKTIGLDLPFPKLKMGPRPILHQRRNEEDVFQTAMASVPVPVPPTQSPTSTKKTLTKAHFSKNKYCTKIQISVSLLF
ncbi:Ankyrin-1 [Manis pentadactyla]|nr:Ankyrin-1 [Manis pentadactyla]